MNRNGPPGSAARSIDLGGLEPGNVAQRLQILRQRCQRLAAGLHMYSPAMQQHRQNGHQHRHNRPWYSPMTVPVSSSSRGTKSSCRGVCSV